jgi:hypothetical protein
MRRYIALGVVVAFVAMGMVLWLQSSADVTNAKAVRSSAAISPHNSKNLPVEHVENPM